MDVPTDDAALEALLRDHRAGPPHPADNSPWDFLLLWPYGILRDRVWPIVSRFLVDADVLLRVRAVDFVRQWDAGADLTTPRLLDVAEQHPDLFGDQEEAGVALRYSMAFALSNRALPPFARRIATVLRDMAASGPIGDGAAGVLARYEPQFAAAYAQQLGDAHVNWIESAARSLALYRRDEVIPFLKAMRGLSESTRVAILDIVEKYMQRDDHNASFIARDEGLEPPKLPAPTRADCRSAIGLSS
jgi:hypothetical protein